MSKEEDHVKKQVLPIFKEAYEKKHGKGSFLNEPQSNHRMVGSGDSNLEVVFLWQPHNHRLYFDFDKTTFNPKKPTNHTLQKYKSMVPMFNTAYTYTALNYDSEHKYDNFINCQIRVKKNQVEVINKSHNKQWRKITASTVDEVDKRIDEVMDNLKEGSVKALKIFMELHGGFSNFRETRSHRCEHGIHGDDYLDKIPSELIINDTYVKKVYKHKAEFLSTAAIKNYVSNRAVEKIYPEIAVEINKLNSSNETNNTELKNALLKLIESTQNLAESQNNLFNENKEVLMALQEQIKSHLALIQEYRKESIEMRKPFFIRWIDYFKKL